MFTIAKRKEYSSTILSKISSLDNDKKGIEKKKTSLASDYDDTDSDDYANRKILFDSQDAYKGMINELYNLCGISYNKDSALYPYLENSNQNISAYATEYPTVYNNSNYEIRNDCTKMFNLLFKWSSDRSTSDLYDPDKIFESTKLQPDNQDESKIPVALKDESKIGEIIKEDKNDSSFKNIYYNFISMINNYISYESESFNSLGINYSDSSSYKILKAEPSALPLTFSYYNFSSYFYTNVVSYSYTDSSAYNKYNDCVISLPKEKSIIICANKNGNYGQLFEVISSECKTWDEVTAHTSTTTGSSGTSSTTTTYTYSHNFKMSASLRRISDVKNYEINNNGYTEKDSTFYFWPSNYQNTTYEVINSVKNKLISAAEKCYNSYLNTPDSAKIIDTNPAVNYPSIISSLKAKNITDKNTFTWFKDYIIRTYSTFINRRINVLISSAKEETYSKPMIDAINARINKDDGTLLRWYQSDCLNNDLMYNKWIKNITNSKSYFLRLGVLKAKVTPGQQCFHKSNSDGTDTITVDTYSNYAASQGTEKEIKEWKKNNPEDVRSPYWIYVEGSFSEYYTRNGITPSLNAGDCIYILDDVKTEMRAYIRSIVKDRIPSGANINSSESNSTVETTYENVLRIECSNIIPTDYSLDNNLRIVKML